MGREARGRLAVDIFSGFPRSEEKRNRAVYFTASLVVRTSGQSTVHIGL